MNGAVFDSTMNIFFKIKQSHLYDAVLATPMSAGDVALGEIGFAVIRGGAYSAAFLVDDVGDGHGASRRGRCWRSRRRC